MLRYNTRERLEKIHLDLRQYQKMKIIPIKKTLPFQYLRYYSCRCFA